MAEFTDQDLTGSKFTRVTMPGAAFERSNLKGATLNMTYLTGARFTACELSDVVMRGVDLIDVDIFGEISNVVINGVDVVPLISAELDRRYPDRVKMRPTDPAGFREAWDAVERLWGGTVDRARTFAPDQLHASVNGEWSFIETLRHLTFATECWVRRALLGDPRPWDPLSLPWDEMPPTDGVPCDRDARPSLETALALRLDRMATVRTYVDTLTDDLLASDTAAVEGPGWPEPRSYPVRECLLIVLNEEWEHRLYAERDLDALQ